MEEWVQKMIERESTPKSLRKETVEDICNQYKISQATYYNYVSKKENQKLILKNCLLLAKKGTPEIMEKLREKAEKGYMRAIDMFLKYVLELSEKFKLGEDPENRFKLPTTLNIIKPNGNANNTTDVQTESSLGAVRE